MSDQSEYLTLNTFGSHAAIHLETITIYFLMIYFMLYAVYMAFARCHVISLLLKKSELLNMKPNRLKMKKNLISSRAPSNFNMKS